MDKDQEIKRLTAALEAIAHSFSDDADYIRNMAARALYKVCDGNQDCALDRLREISMNIDPKTLKTTESIICSLGDTHLVPDVHLHGSTSNVELSWTDENGFTVMLFITDEVYELRTYQNGRLVRTEHKKSFIGRLPDEVMKMIPKKSSVQF